MKKIELRKQHHDKDNDNNDDNKDDDRKKKRRTNAPDCVFLPRCGCTCADPESQIQLEPEDPADVQCECNACGGTRCQVRICLAFALILRVITPGNLVLCEDCRTSCYFDKAKGS